MPEQDERRISADIDTLIAIAGIIIGFGLTGWFSITTANRLYPIMGIIATLACAMYLFVKKRMKSDAKLASIPDKYSSLSVYLILSIMFFVLVAYALFAVNTRLELYVRPFGYFISIALACAVLTVQILVMPPRENYSYFTLFMIAILAIVLIWTPQVIFPNLLGMDPYYHRDFTQTIIDTMRIPTGEGYSAFPVMHLTTGITMLLTNLDYKTAVMVGIALSYMLIGTSVVYLLGTLVNNFKLGLMAALLLGFSALFVHYGWWMAPNGYASVFFLLAMWLVFSVKNSHSKRITALAMLVMAILILAHTITALALVLVLLIFWLGSLIYAPTYKTEKKTLINISFWALFGIALFTWWQYSSSTTITTLQQLVSSRFSVDVFSKPTQESLAYMSTIPLFEHVVRDLGQILFWAFSLIGCLAFFSKRQGSVISFALSLTGLALLSIGFFSGPLGLGTIPERWQFLSLFGLAVPAGFGVIQVSNVLKPGLIKIASMFVMITVLAFISIMSPIATIDNRMLAKNSTVRYAYTRSELIAADTLSNRWLQEVATDDYYLERYGALIRPVDLTDNFVSNKFVDRKDLVVIRQDVVDEPFHLPGIYKLDYNPRQTLEKEGFSIVYDCGTVSAYYQNIEIKQPEN